MLPLMEGSADDFGAPESWEVADLEESVKRILLKDVKSSAVVTESLGTSNIAPTSSSELPSSSGSDDKDGSFFESAVNQVDQFLREALQNPRERLSVLRMERDVEKFIRDPTQQQLEFQQLPTSYLRLAAHRVAQHYSLQSMVLLDNNSDEGSGSKIIVRKTSECRLPAVRLADVPINMPADEGDVIKVAIKQRPQQHLQSSFQSSTSKSLKESLTKTVEERKEEYNKARARIFNSASCSNNSSGKSENQARLLDGYRHAATRVEEKSVIGSDPIRGPVECTIPAVKPARIIRAERDPVSRWRPRVAIFRDREVDKQDPDYDRSYERYMQRFDPGFGFNGGPYPIQPLYSPAVNYNTEFPQLGSSRRPQASLERQSTPLPQHAHSPWPAGACSYAHPESVMPPFNPASTSSMFMHSSQYACQRPGIPFMYSMEHVQQPFVQSRQQQEMSFGVARPR